MSRISAIPDEALENEKEAAREQAFVGIGLQDTVTILDHVVARLRLSLNRDNVRLNWNSPQLTLSDEGSEFSVINITSSSLDRLVTNLCENSFQAGATDVWVSLECQNPRSLVIRIVDNGPGGLAENLAPIKKPKSKGNGLGLEIVREILESSLATYTVVSNPGEGTTFDIKFKIASRVSS